MQNGYNLVRLNVVLLASRTGIHIQFGHTVGPASPTVLCMLKQGCLFTPDNLQHLVLTIEQVGDTRIRVINNGFDKMAGKQVKDYHYIPLLPAEL